jgi:K+-sensing histidine kinase KdpD
LGLQSDFVVWGFCKGRSLRGIRACRGYAPNEGSIASEERETIFDPFVRGAYASAEGRPGVGLGLAIARQLAIKLDGTLELAQDDASGRVEFVLRLPIPAAGRGALKNGST